MHAAGKSRIFHCPFETLTLRLPTATSSGKPSFSKKQADLFFPPDFADDFPVAMQVSDSGGEGQVLLFSCSCVMACLARYQVFCNVSSVNNG